MSRSIGHENSRSGLRVPRLESVGRDVACPRIFPNQLLFSFTDWLVACDGPRGLLVTSAMTGDVRAKTSGAGRRGEGIFATGRGF